MLHSASLNVQMQVQEGAAKASQSIPIQHAINAIRRDIGQRIVQTRPVTSVGKRATRKETAPITSERGVEFDSIV